MPHPLARALADRRRPDPVGPLTAPAPGSLGAERFVLGAWALGARFREVIARVERQPRPASPDG